MTTDLEKKAASEGCDQVNKWNQRRWDASDVYMDQNQHKHHQHCDLIVWGSE